MQGPQQQQAQHSKISTYTSQTSPHKAQINIPQNLPISHMSQISTTPSPSLQQKQNIHDLPLQQFWLQFKHKKIDQQHQQSSINFFNRIIHLLFQLQKNNKMHNQIPTNIYIHRLIHLLICKITKSTYSFQSQSSQTSKIEQVNIWKIQKMSPTALQTCGYLLAYIIQQLCLMYLLLRLGLDIEYKTFNFFILLLENYRNIDKYNYFIREMLIKIVDYIHTLSYINPFLLKIYTKCLIIILNNISKKQQLQQISTYILPFSLLQCLHTCQIHEPKKYPSTQSINFTQQRQDIFQCLCYTYLLTSSNRLLQLIYTILQNQITINMVNKCWNFLNSDLYIQLANSSCLARLGQLLQYIKQKNRNNVHSCVLYNNNSRVSVINVADKKNNLLVLKYQIKNPKLAYKVSKKMLIVLRIQMDLGMLYFYVSNQAIQNNRQMKENKNTKQKQKYILKVRKQLRDKSQQKQPDVQLFQLQKSIQNLTIQIRSDKKMYINCKKYHTQISHALYGRCKVFTIGKRQEEKEIYNMVSNVFNFYIIQDMTVDQYFKQKQQKIGNMDKNLSQSISSSFKNQVNPKKGTPQTQKTQQKYNLIESLLILQKQPKKSKLPQKQKIQTKQYQYCHLQLHKNQNYRQIILKFGGKNKLCSYLLNIFQNFQQMDQDKDYKIRLEYLDWIVRQWKLFQVCEEDLGEIAFLHGFYLYINNQYLSNKGVDNNKEIGKSLQYNQKIYYNGIKRIQQLLHTNKYIIPQKSNKLLCKTRNQINQNIHLFKLQLIIKHAIQHKSHASKLQSQQYLPYNQLQLYNPQQKSQQKLQYDLDKNNQQECYTTTIQQIFKNIGQYVKYIKNYPQKQQKMNSIKRICKFFNYTIWCFINDYVIIDKGQFKGAATENKKIGKNKKDYIENKRNMDITDINVKLFSDIMSEGIKKIVSICQGDKQLQGVIIQSIILYLQLVLVICSNISIQHHLYNQNLLYSILLTIYKILHFLNKKLLNLKPIPQPQQHKIYQILSQLFNILPSLSYYITATKITHNQSDFSKDLKFYIIYTSKQKRYLLQSDKYYSLMQNYYYLLFEFGSFCMKDKKNGFLTYMAYTYKFLNEKKMDFNWNFNQSNIQILTIRDKIMIIELYVCCWKFVMKSYYKNNNFNTDENKNNKQKQNTSNLYSFDRQIQIQICQKLSQLCLPIYYVNNNHNEKESGIIQKIIIFYYQSGINQQLPTNILVNIQASSLKIIIKNIEQKLTKYTKSSQQIIQLNIYLLHIINQFAKPILPITLPQKQKPKTIKSQFLQKLTTWSTIYCKIKQIYQFLLQDKSQQQISNYKTQKSQFQTNLTQQFKIILQQLNNCKQYQNLKFLIYNFIQTSNKNKRQQSHDQDTGSQSQQLFYNKNKEYYLPFLQLLINQCREINANIHNSKKQKKKDKEKIKQNQIFNINSKDQNIYLCTYRMKIGQYIQLNKKQQNMNWKLFQKIMIQNRQYFMQMHSKIAKNKTNTLISYLKMIEKLSFQQKIYKFSQNNRKYSRYDYYILDDWLSNQNVKVMLKRDPIAFLSNMILDQIPRLDDDKKLNQHTIYAIKIIQNLITLNKNRFFEINMQNILKLNEQNSKQKGFVISAFLITKSKIYQGKIEIDNKYINFTQNNYINHGSYKQLFANKSEQRKQQQISVSRKVIKIAISEVQNTQKKNYLQKFPSLQLYALNLSYFFVFQDKTARNKFLTSSEIKTKINLDKQQYVNQLKKKWQKGWISNFQLIVTVNNISGRSFNDVSQYYIFPWTVINFKDYMTAQFFNYKNNFRDLSKSIGSLNQHKLQIVLNKYSNNFFEKDSSQTPYMFGSFYSNPAIVCNYLLRVNPFTIHHYQLQGNQFDLYDRLFTNIQDQFTNNRELLPQFYCAPQFFRNRNRYNFAHSNPNQNKLDLTMNFPKWVITKSPQEFVFKMRKVLQSQFVSIKLGSWIDLIFGYKSQQENAAQHHNLYIHELYQTDKSPKKKQMQKSITQSQIQKKAHMIKQFGQVPKNIFGKKPSLKPKYHQVSQNIFNQKTHQTKLIVCKAPKKIMTQGENVFDFYQCNLVIYNNKKLIIMNTKQQVNICEKQLQQQLKSLTILPIRKRKLLLIFALTASGFTQLYLVKRGMKPSLILSRSQQYRIQENIKIFQNTKFTQVKTTGNYAILVENNLLKILEVAQKDKKDSNTNSTYMQIGQQLILKSKGYLNYHRNPITNIQTYPGLSIIVTVDTKGLSNVFSFEPQLTIRSTFSLTTLKQAQKIKKILIHSMGVMTLLTNQNQFLVYNIYGDLILKLNLQINQGISDIAFWDSNSSSQLLLLSKNGNLFQFDIFQMLKPGQDCIEGVYIEMNSIPHIKQVCSKVYGNNLIMYRFGRLWEIKIIQCDKDFTKQFQSKVFFDNINSNTNFKNT